MHRTRIRWRAAALSATAIIASAAAARAQPASDARTGEAALGDWKADAPGVWRRVTVHDLPKPYATPPAGNPPSVADKPAGSTPKTPPGFAVAPFVTGLTGPRLMRTAPNGDIFVVESVVGRIRVLRTTDGAAKPTQMSTFAEGLSEPFGVAFYPAGPNPQWVYVGNTNSVVRFPYRSGDLKARGAPETIVPKLTQTVGGHITRDLAFSPDGRRLYVSVGSGSNVAEHMPKKTLAEAQAFDADQHAVGATWGTESDRADVLVFTPEGGPPHIYASGIRNCVGLGVNPTTQDVWCSTNERDGLGDNLVPDYVTRVREGGFYGWPWDYMGGNEDPRHAGERPDLAGKVITPDVLLQSHSAPLEMTFYPGGAGPAAFPAEYRGDAFVALHGSWNRHLRTGYKVVRLKLNNGVPTGVYEDFLTGFVIDNEKVWGRPVGVTVAHDGALLVSEDGNGVIYRVAPTRDARR